MVNNDPMRLTVRRSSYAADLLPAQRQGCGCACETAHAHVRRVETLTKDIDARQWEQIPASIGGEHGVALAIWCPIAEAFRRHPDSAIRGSCLLGCLNVDAKRRTLEDGRNPQIVLYAVADEG